MLSFIHWGDKHLQRFAHEETGGAENSGRDGLLELLEHSAADGELAPALAASTC